MLDPAMSGMEIQAIRALARTMDERADEIERLLGSVTNQVDNLNWRGADRERFVKTWQSEHATNLRRVATGLREAAEHARGKAAEQERISQAR